MATYSTLTTARLDSRTVVAVVSPLTRYTVEEDDNELILRGPGVEETYLIGQNEEIPVGLSPGARALFAVLLWEDQA